MKENRATGKFTDVNIICHNNCTFQCHRHILAVASPYFDIMFSGNFLESRIAEVKLDINIDSTTFELLLEYIYSGSVAFINDSNVYNLLKASDILGLESVEEACVHYFSKEGVPMDAALDVVEFACATNKKSLMLVISRFIMEHLEDSTISQIPLHVLSTLLSHFCPHSSPEEKAMLNNIFKWLRLSNSTPENHKTSFIQLMQNHYSNLSAEFVEDYLDKMMIEHYELDTINHRKPLSMLKHIGFCDYSKPFLHLFMSGGSKSTNILPLHFQRIHYSICWNWNNSWLRSDACPGRSNLRCAIIGNNRYSLFTYLKKSNSKIISCFEFIKYYLTGRVEPLMNPPLVLTNTFSYRVCSDEVSSIYLFASNNANSLCVYDCRWNQWSKVDTGDEFCPRAMTWYDRRLYVFGGQNPTSVTNEMRAYDSRTGQFEKFPNCNQLYTGTHFECSYHRGQIYLATLRHKPHYLGMEVFDPVAGKRMNFVESPEESRGDREYRLVSFNGQLWAFHCDVLHKTCVRRYDVHRELWENVEMDSIYQYRSLFDYDWDLLDAVAS